MKRVGFTGTRQGMTPQQLRVVESLLIEIAGEFFHHGDCIGADFQAASLAHAHGYKIVCHPPLDNKLRAYSKNSSFMLKPKSHFARNRDIVDDTEHMIATPPYADPITPATKGGTAYTVNYARKRGKPVVIVRPDGSVEREPGK
jgi:hypothetical protein